MDDLFEFKFDGRRRKAQQVQCVVKDQVAAGYVQHEVDAFNEKKHTKKNNLSKKAIDHNSAFLAEARLHNASGSSSSSSSRVPALSPEEIETRKLYGLPLEGIIQAPKNEKKGKSSASKKRL